MNYAFDTSLATGASMQMNKCSLPHTYVPFYEVINLAILYLAKHTYDSVSKRLLNTLQNIHMTQVRPNTASSIEENGHRIESH
ncbi:hypothetical protein TSUD_202820 [Trifolium subterraneum]|uniref:Uncharacterized protein n=1 Tax=Trifolium subterraneum TaxID=3900 RepID=A0A2Z6M891_TRISU|nr:hypothetical protein TSUD_202820 [Trifolium subterraneum]